MLRRPMTKAATFEWDFWVTLVCKCFTFLKDFQGLINLEIINDPANSNNNYKDHYIIENIDKLEAQSLSFLYKRTEAY